MGTEFKEHVDLWAMRIGQAQTHERRVELLEECLSKSPSRPNRHKIQVKKTVAELLDALYNRSGFDSLFDSLDESIEEEITSELESIIERRLHKD